MTITISVASNEARLTGLLNFLDQGGNVARIALFPNNRPTIADAPGADFIVEIPLLKPAGSVSNNKLTLHTADPPLNVNTGTPVWARVINGEGATVFDCDVSLVGGTGEIQLSSLSLFAGGETRMVSGVLG